MYKRQSEQDRAALRAWGSRGLRRLYWRLRGWYYGRNMRFWAGMAVCALVALAILGSLS